MKKLLKRFFLGLVILLLLMPPVLYFGGKWWIKNYLGRELALGDGILKLVGADITWGLNFRLDSLYYESPTIRANTGEALAELNLFSSLFRFTPDLDLDLDTLLLHFSPGPDTVKEKIDSLAFPDFKLPLSATVTAHRISLANDSGPIVHVHGLELVTKGRKAVALEIDSLRTPALAGMQAPSLTAGLDWAANESVGYSAKLLRENDFIHLKGQHHKRNLFHGEDKARLHMVSSRPYERILNDSLDIPHARDLDFSADLVFGTKFKIDARLTGQVSEFDDSAAYQLSTQQLSLNFFLEDTSGHWKLESRGEEKENILLEGNLLIGGLDTLPPLPRLLEQAALTAHGHIRNIPLIVRKERVSADLTLPHLRFRSRENFQSLEARIKTGDGSLINAALNRKGGQAAEWAGTFGATLEAEERWLGLFLDTSISFRSLRVTGSLRGKEIRATTMGYEVKAYGALADSLTAHHHFGPRGYVLEPSLLYYQGKAWASSGRVKTGKGFPPMVFRMANAELGSAEYAMPRQGVMEVSVSNLALGRIPYHLADTAAPYEPRITGRFRWDMKGREGETNFSVRGRYEKSELGVKVRAQWNPDTLHIPELQAEQEGSILTAAAKIAIHGRQFFELAKSRPADFQRISLQAKHFDLAKALAVFMPDPPLENGIMDGTLSYSSTEGFDGRYVFRDPKPKAVGELFKISSLFLDGRGDSLIIRARTQSESEPLLNDSLRVAISGILGEVQEIQARIAANGSLFLSLDAHSRRLEDLEGRLGLKGAIALSGNSGRIQDISMAADFSLPFKDALKKLNLKSEIFRGTYIVPGLDTQRFSAEVAIADGVARIPSLTLDAGEGKGLRGSAQYALTGNKVLTANLRGESLALQWKSTDKLLLEGLQAEVRMDSSMTLVRAQVNKGTVEHIKARMRAAGQVENLNIVFRRPKAKERSLRENGSGSVSNLPSLTIRGNLRDSELRYRMRTMETFQNLFKRDKTERRAQRTNPIQVDLDLQTVGSGNKIDTDILRMAWVGDIRMHGTYPYALMNGRISAAKGEFGIQNRAYTIRSFEVKWLNVPLEEGSIAVEAEKKLASNCDVGTQDSCTVVTQLDGSLQDMRFSYRSDCGGAFGTGADIRALVFSVQRGCYSGALADGGTGESYGEQALALLEPLVSRNLSRVVERYSGNWIASTQVTGLGALASSGDSLEAIALEVLSKEFWRLRFRAKSGYQTESKASNPWAHKAAVEWRPPLAQYLKSPKWRERIKNNLRVEASVSTDPQRAENPQEDEITKRVGLNYNYNFWGKWWSKPGKIKQAQPDSGVTEGRLRDRMNGPAAEAIREGQ